MDWYYEKDGEQQGPVSESMLMQLFANGTIGPSNLVWRQGMSDWASYDSVFADLPGPIVDADSGPAGASRGTGGKTPNSEIRAMARETLSGKWGTAVLVMFLFGLLQQVGAFIPLAGPIIQWLILGPLMLGFYAFFIGLHRREPVEVGTLFSGFSRFGRGLGIYFVTTLIIGGVVMLAALPGIVLMILAHTSRDYAVPEESPLFIAGILAAVFPAIIASTYMYLRYAFVYLVANDHPELGVLDSIKRSTQIVNGHKGRLLLLWISFLGWHLLGAMAFFIGLLWSATYMFAATVAFYEDLGEG